MKILFVTVGKEVDKKISEAVFEYTNRINNYFKTEWKIIPTSDIKKEGQNILKSIEDGDFIVALDEKGKELTTFEIAGFLEKRMIAGDKRIIFVIGGAYGIDEEVMKRSNLKWSLSKLTFPHQIVRLILAETVYRAISVVKGEPYHHK